MILFNTGEFHESLLPFSYTPFQRELAESKFQFPRPSHGVFTHPHELVRIDFFRADIPREISEDPIYYY